MENAHGASLDILLVLECLVRLLVAVPGVYNDINKNYLKLLIGSLVVQSSKQTRDKTALARSGKIIQNEDI